MDDAGKYGGSLPGCRICSHTVYRRQTRILVSSQDKLWIPHYNGRGPTLTDSNSDQTITTLCIYKQYFKITHCSAFIIMTCNVLKGIDVSEDTVPCFNKIRSSSSKKVQGSNKKLENKFKNHPTHPNPPPTRNKNSRRYLLGKSQECSGVLGKEEDQVVF